MFRRGSNHIVAESPLSYNEGMKLSAHAKKILLPSQALGIMSVSAFLVRGDWAWFPAILAGWALISGFGIAIGFHRLFSHRAFETYRPVKLALAYLGSMAGQGSPLFWAALHRGYHHPHSDTDLDYHSPTHGKWNAYMGWQLNLPPRAVSFRFVKDLAREPFLKWLHRNYNRVFWGSIILSLVISWQLALYGLLIPIFISPHIEGAINLFCHSRDKGYRNFETNDNSVNYILFGFLSWGQAFHNNHHAHPKRFNYGVKWYEIDISRWIVPLLRKRSSL